MRGSMSNACRFCGSYCVVGAGYCHCGCKSQTPIATHTKTKYGIKKGFPTKYIPSHQGGIRRLDDAQLGEFKIDGSPCRLIALTQGQYAIVDSWRYKELSAYRWYANWNGCTRSYYAGRNAPLVNGDSYAIWMHREVLGLKRGDLERTDHVNHCTTDNRGQNLRIATGSQNGMNQRKRITNTSGRKGVSFHRSTGKHQVQIMVDGVQYYLGEYCNFEKACAVREAAEKKYHGEFARFE